MGSFRRRSFTPPGDDMVNVVQHGSNGCAETEDECAKLFRAFVQTMTWRWGGTLNASPTVDAAAFGNPAATPPFVAPAIPRHCNSI